MYAYVGMCSLQKNVTLCKTPYIAATKITNIPPHVNYTIHINSTKNTINNIATITTDMITISAAQNINTLYNDTNKTSVYATTTHATIIILILIPVIHILTPTHIQY